MNKAVTKKEVEEIIEKNNEKLISSIKEEFLHVYEILAQHDKKFVKLENDIVQFKDDILHEIVDLRDDITVVTGYRKMLEDHDHRIVKIETKVFSVKVSS